MWPYAILLYIGTTWSLTVTCGKFATSQGIPALSYTFWTMAVTGVAMALLAAVWGGWPRLTRAHMVYFFLTGLTRVSLPNASLYLAVAHVPQGVVSILMVTGPMIVYLLSLAIGHERFMPVRLLGLLFGLAGAALIVIPKGSLPDPDMVWWVVLGFGCPFFYALSTLVIERMRPPASTSTALVAGTVLSGAVMLFPLALIPGDFHPLWLPITSAELAIFAHVVITSICFIGQFELLRMAGAVFTSLQSYLTAFAGIFWGMVFFGETHSLWIWSALALVLVGVTLVSRRQSFRRG